MAPYRCTRAAPLVGLLFAVTVSLLILLSLLESLARFAADTVVPHDGDAPVMLRPAASTAGAELTAASVVSSWPAHLDLTGTGVQLVEAFPSSARWAALPALRAATPSVEAAGCLPALIGGAFDERGAAVLAAAPGRLAADFARALRSPLDDVAAAATGGAALDVNSGVAREWARVRAVWADGSGRSSGSFDSPARRPKVRMAAASHARFCATPHVRDDPISRMFTPRGGCSEGVVAAEAAATAAASEEDDSRHDVYLNDPAEAVHILSADCVVTEVAGPPSVVQFALLHPAHLYAQLELNVPRPPAGLAVTEVDEAASVGPLVYPNALGHFLNEALVQYFLLDALLPVDIPLIVGHEGRGADVLAQLRAAGVMQPARPLLHMSPNAPGLLRARRMFFLRPTGRNFNEYPSLTSTGMRLLGASLAAAAWRRAHNGAPPPPLGVGDDERARTVLLLSRDPGARYVENSDAIMAAVHRALAPAVVHVSSIVPGADFLDVGRSVNAAGLVIGPHGANLGNVLFLAQGSWLVEIGYLATPGAFKLPHTYHGLARNMNLTYWTSFASAGSHDGPLTADIADIEEILGAYRREVLVPKGLV